MRVAIGQDSHAFAFDNREKPLRLGGVVFENQPPLRANSDGDVVLHALANAISGITGVNILGKVADDLCQAGITDSRAYVEEALKHPQGKVAHVSVSIECLLPPISPKITEMRQSIAEMLGIHASGVGITATTGEGLTAFGQGKGIQAFCCITVE